MLTLIGFAAAVLLSLPLLAIGLRGRRTDDHPLCRRCGYDLTGRSGDATRCPECGADLARRRATRVGHRRRRPGLIVAGIGLALAALAVAAPAARRLARTDPITLVPIWWLRHELNGPASGQVAALAELSRRQGMGRLSAAQVAAVSDRALEVQSTLAARPPGWWVSAHQTDIDAAMTYFRFVQAAHADHQLDRARWAAYACHTLRPSITARPIVRRGDPLPLAYVVDRLTGDGPFCGRLGLRDLRMDGRPLEPPLVAGDPGAFIDGVRMHHLDVEPLQEAGADPVIDGGAVRALVVGPHTVSGVLRFAMYEGIDDFDVATLTDPRPPPADKWLGTIDVPVAATFIVCSTADAPPLTKADAERSRYHDISATLSVRPGDAVGSLCVEYDGPADARAVHVLVRPAGGPERQVDRPGDERRWSLELSGGARYIQTFPVGLDRLGPARRFDVIVRPAADLAVRTTDMQAAWGDELVTHDVRTVEGKP